MVPKITKEQTSVQFYRLSLLVCQIGYSSTCGKISEIRSMDDDVRPNILFIDQILLKIVYLILESLRAFGFNQK